MSDAVEVAIVGAGPYGLSLGAHLRKAGVSVRQFGLPMQLWRDFMPEGMYLKSQGFASNLSDPDHTHTLEAFCKATGRPYRDYGLPVALDTFVAYGQWFREALVPDIDEVLVTDIAKAGDGFEVTLANSEQVRARKVVVAIGVEAFAYTPEPLSALPASVCTHASAHTDLGVFKDQEVIVVGCRPVGARVGRAAAREGRQRPARREEGRHPLERRAAGAGPSGDAAAQGARVGPWVRLGHLVLLQPPRCVPASAAVHPDLPGQDRARPGRCQLAA